MLKQQRPYPHSRRQYTRAGVHFSIAPDAHDERLVRQREICPPAESNLSRGETNAYLPNWRPGLLVSLSRRSRLLSPGWRENSRARHHRSEERRVGKVGEYRWAQRTLK